MPSQSSAYALKLCVISILASFSLLTPNVESVAQQKVRVPNLIGSSLSQATDVLEKVGLRLGTVRETLHGPKCRILEQDPRPGRIVSRDTRVNLVVSSPTNISGLSCVPTSRSELTGSAPPSPPKPKGYFSAVDDVLARLPLGQVVFHVPNVMSLHQGYDIRLLLSASKSLEELKKELPGKIEGAEIRIAEKMQARLTAQDFTISAVKPEIQAVSGQQNTEWEWEVRPTAGGIHELHLTIDVILLVNNVETPHSITTLDRKITITVTFAQHVTGFIGKNWQWLWTAVLIPVAAWLWKKKDSKKKRAQRDKKR